MPTFDPSADFLDITDGLESVSLKRRSGSGKLDQSIEKALRRAVNFREIQASSGLYVGTDLVWHYAALSQEVTPDIGDVIVDSDSQEWTILNFAKQTLGSRWRCVTRNLVITERLDTLLTIEVGTFKKGESGAEEVTWTAQETQIRARVQPDQSDDETRHGGRQLRRRVRIYCREEFAVKLSNRLVDSSGTKYRVVGFEMSQRVGELFTILAEVTQ